jgi:hypothetical protein
VDINAFGANALYSNTTGASITAVGIYAGYLNTTGYENTFIGFASGYNNTTGFKNIGLGWGAFANESAGCTGDNNIGVGLYTLSYLTSGSSNIAIGTEALYANTTASNNTAVGVSAGYSTTGGNNTFLGQNSGYGVTTGTKNTIIGSYTGGSAPISATGSNYIVLSDGDGNVRGTFDSSGNFLVGTTTSSLTSGDGFVFTTDTNVSGAKSGYASNTQTCWNMYSTGAAAYRFYVGWGGTIFATSIVITAISDQRLKENVRDIDTGLDAIMALKPRRFDWKEGKGQDKKDVAGFIAQEFEAVFPECVSTSKAGADGIEYKNINHETLIPTLVKAIQELKAEFDAYKATHP